MLLKTPLQFTVIFMSVNENWQIKQDTFFIFIHNIDCGQKVPTCSDSLC